MDEKQDTGASLRDRADGLRPQPAAQSSQSSIPSALDLIAADREALLTALYDAKLQLEYLDDRCPTGTTPATLARVKHALSEALPWEVFAQAIEARSGETEGLDPKDESAVRQDAPEPPSHSTQGDSNV